MKNKKKRKHVKTDYSRVFSLALIWTMAIFFFVIMSFSYGVNRVSGTYIANRSLSNNDKLSAVSGERGRLEKIWDNVDAHLRSNISIIAAANNAGDDELIASDIDFINDNRALIFYEDKKDDDHYLAEVVFAKDSDQVKIERFILKVENDTDYSGGLYGAD